MAALLEMVRDHRQFPAMSEKERNAEYGTYPPIRRRASLPASQRRTARGPVAKDETPANTQAFTRTTDDLEDEQYTPKHSTPPIRRGNGNNDSQGYYQPQANPSSRRGLFTWLCGIAGTLTILYTLVFFIAAGWTDLTNTLAYGPTHTAYTQAMINGQPYTIQTSNASGTILITLINNRDGSAKTYSYNDLNPNAWNDDLSGIVATATIEQNTITIHLTGSMNYFRLLFTRPQMKLQLLPDKQAGYKVIVAS